MNYCLIHKIKENSFNRILFGLLAFYLLNISIDLPDKFNDSVPENLAFNDQESIIEFIAEKVLGFENAFEEYDDFDNPNPKKKSNNKVEVYKIQSFFYFTEVCFFKNSLNQYLYNNFDIISHFYTIDTPPPDHFI